MKLPLRKALLIIPAVLVLAFVAWIILSADVGHGVPGFITALYAFPNGDKVGHFLLMGALAFVLTLALPRKAQFPGLVLLSLLLAAEEFSQRFFGRHSTWADLLSSLAGVLVLGGLAVWLTRKKSPKM
jgi:polysaccharide biosynthesis protein VpsQ